MDDVRFTFGLVTPLPKTLSERISPRVLDLSVPTTVVCIAWIRPRVKQSGNSMGHHRTALQLSSNDSFQSGRIGMDPSLLIATDSPKYFRLHPSQIEGQELNWVAASGIENVGRITIPVAVGGAKAVERNYNLRFWFAEPTTVEQHRIFDVSVQGKKVLDDFEWKLMSNKIRM